MKHLDLKGLDWKRDSWKGLPLIGRDWIGMNWICKDLIGKEVILQYSTPGIILYLHKILYFHIILYRASKKKIDLLYLLNISGTKKRISKPFSSSEN